ncbi:glycerophosphodiester phosphodiesterase, partial [Xanthomonas citri pv. citri]|nr:glycerophosphodiester phosphodiesterase [Xanthomonas citri pv. citri]
MAENSLAALKLAQELGVWGSEFDVWITTDGRIVINHDSTFPTDTRSRKIQECTFEQLSDIRLS